MLNRGLADIEEKRLIKKQDLLEDIKRLKRHHG